MKKTSERIALENADNFLIRCHEERYLSASKFVKGQTVLDIACGTGYGTVFLKRRGKAKQTIGVDNNLETIEYCRKKYPKHAKEFYLADACHLPFKNDIFDVVVSFETIEHIKDYTAFLDEIRRVLKKNGILVLSTPNYRFELIKNKYHLKNFRRAEFLYIFKKLFREAKFYGQSQWFLPFPGRGRLERFIRLERSCEISPLESLTREPQILLVVAKNKK